jgi:hypothetical protein
MITYEKGGSTQENRSLWGLMLENVGCGMWGFVGSLSHASNIAFVSVCGLVPAPMPYHLSHAVSAKEGKGMGEGPQLTPATTQARLLRLLHHHLSYLPTYLPTYLAT